ncbi:MAG: helix-turn-helix domain-containing protein [Oligoflexales bacterium]
MKIEQIRKAQSLTQTELAEKCETTQQQIAKLERGLSDPKLSTLGRVAAALNCTIQDLLFSPSEFESLVNDIIRKKNIKVGDRTTAELSLICAREGAVSCFDPLWERAEISQNRVKIRRKS